MKPSQLAIATLSLLTLTSVFMSSGPADAQTEIAQATSSEVWIPSDAIELNRAKNYARQAAERVNGGLENYRAEPAMHGPSSDAPFIDNGDGTWTFTFLGRRPVSEVYSIETVVTVSQETRQVTVDYNGQIRQ